MKTRIVRFVYARRAALKRLLPIRRPVLLRLREFSIYVRLDDWAVGARIALRRRYEPHVVSAMRPLLAPGAVVVDVGANIGYYTLLAAARVGARGRVIAFEPSRDNCALLRMSLHANRFENVALHPLAVAEAGGTVGFGMDDSNGRISRGDPAASALQVPAVALDEFLREEPRIDLIKLDIEGAEARALRGMAAIVRRHQPVIFTEFGPRGLEVASGVRPRDYLEHLRALGYALFLIPAEGGGPRGPLSDDQILARFAAPSRADHVDLAAFPGGRRP
jgi:FkbM family methyltransferase